MRCRLDVADVERFDVGGVLEDVAELPGELVDLGVRERQPSQASYVHHVITGDARGFRHGAKDTCPPRPIYARRCMRHPFLSPEWIAAMRDIRADYAEHDREVEIDIAANVTVTDPPFGDGAILGHVDTTGPTLMIEEGHLDDADFGLEVPYAIAKQLFVDRDPSQVMPALMGGKFKLTGDSSKVLALASLISPPPSGATGVDALPEDADVPTDVLRGIARRIDEITEP